MRETDPNCPSVCVCAMCKAERARGLNFIVLSPSIKIVTRHLSAGSKNDGQITAR